MRLSTHPFRDSYETRRDIQLLNLIDERDANNKFRLLAARLVDAVNALEGEPISYTLGKNLATAADAVRVALGNPSRLATTSEPGRSEEGKANSSSSEISKRRS